jgi:uncharacterized protein YdhG (YjbR/CyaY superfamily)
MPKRSNVDDYFAALPETQRPHLEALRQLSRQVEPERPEVLKWNLPVYVDEHGRTLWMLQNFRNHCSLRFTPEFFATQRDVAEAAGLETGAGFVKLPYDRPLPLMLLKQLMISRLHHVA